MQVKSEDVTEIRILSIGQFRPEKNHELQLKAFAELQQLVDVNRTVKLILAGSCRHEEDGQRVDDLKLLAKKLEIDHLIEWKLNIPYLSLIEELSAAMIGLHTMWNEHFGIGIVTTYCKSAIVRTTR